MWCCKHRQHVKLAETPPVPKAPPAKPRPEGRICPITGLEGICPMARKPQLKEGEKAPELKVLMFLMWEEGESKVSVGVYPHQSPHWAALEIPDTSSKEEIKAQYRKLSVKYHPDKNKEVPREKFQRITEAYEALKDTDGQLAFPWESFPERQQAMKGPDLIRTLGFLGAEVMQQDPIKAQFMQQVVKEATDCKVLLHEKETKEEDKTRKEVWADALCVDERTGANHLVKVYRRIVRFTEESLEKSKEGLEEVED